MVQNKPCVKSKRWADGLHQSGNLSILPLLSHGMSALLSRAMITGRQPAGSSGASVRVGRTHRCGGSSSARQWTPCRRDSHRLRQATHRPGTPGDQHCPADSRRDLTVKVSCLTSQPRQGIVAYFERVAQVDSLPLH